MKVLELTLPTPAENLALDEALLDEAEESSQPREFLRLWESPQLAVVIGRSSKAREEVCVEYCRDQGIPVVRRCSGGAAVVIGPGCLMYAVVLQFQQRPALRMIDEAHRYVLGSVARAIQRCHLAVACQGTSDLTWENRKISGNSLRCKRQSLLYHGTIMCGLATTLMEACLRAPPRQPEYRRQRRHGEFVTNLPVSADLLRAALRTEWQANEALAAWPQQRTAALVVERYARDEWNLRH